MRLLVSTHFRYQINLDYSMDSLSRIDALLDRIRAETKPAFPAFLNSQANANFVLLIAFYMGKVAANSSGARIDWYKYEQLQRLHPQMVTFKHIWTTSLMCVLNKRPDGDGQWLFPFAAIFSRLCSADKVKSVRIAVEDLADRARSRE